MVLFGDACGDDGNCGGDFVFWWCTRYILGMGQCTYVDAALGLVCVWEGGLNKVMMTGAPR